MVGFFFFYLVSTYKDITPPGLETLSGFHSSRVSSAPAGPEGLVSGLRGTQKSPWGERAEKGSSW